MSLAARDRLEGVLGEGLAAVDVGDAVSRFVQRTESNEIRIGDRVLAPAVGIWVAALGKAAPKMLTALERVASDRIRGGLAVAPDGHFSDSPSGITQVVAGHPIPNEAGERAARELLALVQDIPRSDLLLVLLSGGASALTACPAVGLNLEDLQQSTRLLLAAGADIAEVNSVRTHCSCFSGGRLAAASRTRMIEVLAISDVVGDHPEVIGSGPCSPDPSTFSDALAVVDRFGLRGEMPTRIMSHLESGVQGDVEESHTVGDPALNGVHYQIISNNEAARRALSEASERRGLRVVDLGEVLSGEARQMGRRLMALARSLRVSEPTLLIAGGETVVRVRGQGRGGRNQELALAAALSGAGQGGVNEVTMVTMGTDGRDGPTPAAGAFAEGETLDKAQAAGLDARAMLDDNDAYGFFSSMGGALVTGPTGTNVMDLVLILVEAKGNESD